MKLRILKIRRQIERRWPGKVKQMTESELTVLANEAFAAGERAVQDLLHRRLRSPR